MAEYVILGHGGLIPELTSYVPGEVLVPTGTTLHFFSDAGQGLMLPGTDEGIAEYSEVAPMFQQLKSEGTPLGPKQVTYNFMLAPDPNPKDLEGAKKADWGGATLVWADNRKLLCTDREGKCPTPKLLVASSRHDELVAMGASAVEALKDMLAAGSGELPPEMAGFKARLEDVPDHYRQYVADGVPEERWTHTCNGILGEYGGNGNKLFWVACTKFMTGVHDLPPLVTAKAAGPGVEVAADWVPDDDDKEEIIERNRRNIKEVDNGGEAGIAVAGGILIIGAGHIPEAAAYVQRQDDLEEGILTVTKGGAFSKGKMEVKGISPGHQQLVRRSIEEFSAKKVTFV